MPESPITHRSRQLANRRSLSRITAGVGALSFCVSASPGTAGGDPFGRLAGPASSTGAGQESPLLAQINQAPLPGGSSSLATPDSDLYVLGPGDSLALTFLDPTAAGVGGGFTILPDGTATLALLGSVQLTGLTIGQATRWLTSLYETQLLRPQLNLSLTAARPVKVTLVGEVQRPGLYPLSVGATAVSAIQGAGGITLNADVRKVLLRRRLPGPEGSQKETQLDLTELLTYGNQLQNPLLFDGDTLLIARTETPLPNEVLQLAATNLSPPSINVTVIGEVKSPGTLSLPANTPLAQALLRAGGPNDWRANRRAVELIRMNRNGTTTREVFNARDPNTNINQGFNPPLRDNDTIIVKRSLYGKTLDLVNQILVPVGAATNILGTYYLFRDYNDRNN